MPAINCDATIISSKQPRVIDSQLQRYYKGISICTRAEQEQNKGITSDYYTRARHSKITPQQLKNIQGPRTPCSVYVLGHWSLICHSCQPLTTLRLEPPPLGIPVSRSADPRCKRKMPWYSAGQGSVKKRGIVGNILWSTLMSFWGYENSMNCC